MTHLSSLASKPVYQSTSIEGGFVKKWQSDEKGAYIGDDCIEIWCHFLQKLLEKRVVLLKDRMHTVLEVSADHRLSVLEVGVDFAAFKFQYFCLFLFAQTYCEFLPF